MKRFICRFTLFISILYLTTYVIDTFLTNKIKNIVYNDYSLWDKMLSGQMNNDLLILGSSRAWVQYSPKILDSILLTNSYNLGRDGKYQDISILCYDVYTKNNPLPKIVLCDIFFMTMSKSDPYSKEQFYPYLLNNTIWKNTHYTHQLRQTDRFIPMAKYFGHIHEIFNKTKDTDSTYKGYYGYDRIWDGLAIKNINTIHYQHDSSVIDMTDKWLKQSKKDGVKVIFVHSPIYIEATNKIDDTAAMWNMYRSLASKYDVPILDYSHDSICYDTTCFYNSQHLNRKGAEKFSLQLANDLKSMGIRSFLQR